MDYTAAVVQAGGLPVPLPAIDVALLEEALALVDGVLLTGGGDVDPATYGADRAPATKYVDGIRDELDLWLLRSAVERDMPVLAVCRGVQVVNVAFGGTLDQDRPDHDIETPARDRVHDVVVTPGTRLADIVGAGPLGVNSLHHQTLLRVGDGLDAVAVAPDGVVEAVEHQGTGLVAVQWHPELLCHQPPHLALFEDLVGRAAASGEGATIEGHDARR